MYITLILLTLANSSILALILFIRSLPALLPQASKF